MMARAIVILSYLIVLAVIVLLPRRLRLEERGRAPWWRNVRFWASVVILVQVAVYVVWG